MKASVAWCALICAGAVVLAVAAARPEILSDANAFLRDFVTHEFLSVLWVILAITLASAGQLHLKFNDIEEAFKRRGLRSTRGGVHRAAYSLIILFVVGIIIVVAKPLIATAVWSQALFNGAALIVLLWYVLILVSLTQTIFRIEPKIDEGDG